MSGLKHACNKVLLPLVCLRKCLSRCADCADEHSEWRFLEWFSNLFFLFFLRPGMGPPGWMGSGAQSGAEKRNKNGRIRKAAELNCTIIGMARLHTATCAELGKHSDQTCSTLQSRERLATRPPPHLGPPPPHMMRPPMSMSQMPCIFKPMMDVPKPSSCSQTCKP